MKCRSLLHGTKTRKTRRSLRIPSNPLRSGRGAACPAAALRGRSFGDPRGVQRGPFTNPWDSSKPSVFLILNKECVEDTLMKCWTDICRIRIYIRISMWSRSIRTLSFPFCYFKSHTQVLIRSGVLGASSSLTSSLDWMHWSMIWYSGCRRDLDCVFWIILVCWAAEIQHHCCIILLFWVVGGLNAKTPVT